MNPATEPATRDVFCLELLLPSESATALLAHLCLPFWRQGGVVYLQGPLGAGKTAFARAFLQALGYKGPVKSPSYAIVEPYPELQPAVYHLDCFRLNDAAEFLSAALHEYAAPGVLLLIEWPERAEPYVPAADWIITLRLDDEDKRLATLCAASQQSRCAWEALRDALAGCFELQQLFKNS